MFLMCWLYSVDFPFNADPIALNLVTHSKTVFRAGTGSCLTRLEWKPNARYVAVKDSFVLISFSTILVPL